MMVDLADYANLAYYAGFTVETPPSTTGRTSPPKHVTFIALSKKAMPQVVRLAETFKEDVTVYADGTVEHVLTVRIRFVTRASFKSNTSCRRSPSPSSFVTTVRRPLSLGQILLYGRLQPTASSPF